MTENPNESNFIDPLDIKQEAIDIYEEFADNNIVLEALRLGATTIKLEDILTNPPEKSTVKKRSTLHDITPSKGTDHIQLRRTLRKLPQKKLPEEKSGPKTKENLKRICRKNLKAPINTSRKKSLGTTAKKGEPLIIDRYKCHCGFATPAKKKLTKHIAKIHKKFICDKCPYRTDKQSFFEKHFFRHQSDRPYICDSCKATFKLRSKLQRHLKIHTYVRKYQCPHCPKSFLENYNLANHLKTHNDLFPYECHLCEFKTKFKNCLTQHLITHSGLRMVSCDFCSFRTFTKGALKSHMYRHQVDRPFACTECPYRAKEKCKLTRHLKVHTKGPCQECYMCAYRTRDRRLYKEHIKRHKAFFPCIICFDIFSKKTVLYRHLERHKLMKDLKCSDCNMKECCPVHKIYDLNLFTCHFCGERFYRKSSIQMHLKRYHGF